MSQKHDEFRDYCIELLSGLRQGEVVAKKMFGGTGFSIDGNTFAIIAFEALWLKVDEVSKAKFADAKCQIFTYEADGKLRTMNYFSAPEEAMESASQMRPWALLAWEAALRASAAKASKKKTPSVARKLASS